MTTQRNTTWWKLEDSLTARRLGVWSCWSTATILLSAGAIEYLTSSQDFPILPTEELPNGNAVAMVFAPLLLLVGGFFVRRAGELGFSIIMNTLITTAGVINVGACLISRDSGVVGTALNLLVAVTAAYLWPIQLAATMAVLSTVGINIIYFAVDPLPVAVSKGLLVSTMVLAAALALGFSKEQQRKAADMLREMAHRDALTGLASRQLIDLAISHRNEKNFPDRGIGLVIFDVDSFKTVNDTHGHAAGDALLRSLANCLKEHTPEGSTAFRLGGDEFGIALIDQSAGDMDRICGDVLASIAGTLIWAHGEKVHLSVSYGADHAATFEGFRDLYPNADKALYQAKQRKHANDATQPPADHAPRCTEPEEPTPTQPSHTA